MSLKGI